MGCQKTIYVAKEIYDYWTENMGSMGFENFSDLVNYAERFTMDYINLQGLKSVPVFNRADTVKICIRTNNFVDSELIGKRFCKKSEVYDLALIVYREVMKRV